ANAVYDSTHHQTLDGVAPSITDAKRKLDAFVAVELRGAHSKQIREIGRAAFDLSNAVQHLQGATLRDALLSAEATITLVRLIGILAGRQATEAVTPKPERRSMTLDERERAVEGLAHSYAPRVIEMLKSLGEAIRTVKVENESGV